MGPRLVCPGQEYSEHDELQQKVREENLLKSGLITYKRIIRRQAHHKLNTHFIQDIQTRIRELEEGHLEQKISELRELFAQREVQNIQGIDTNQEVRKDNFLHYVPYTEKRRLRDEGK